jgi:hypothetical protein
MPLGCAKREKFYFVSELPDVQGGLSTAFQQFLWKGKSRGKFDESGGGQRLIED